MDIDPDDVEASVLLAMAPTDDKARLQHAIKMVFALKETVEWKEDAPVLPFFIVPYAGCGSFKGVGTNNLEAVKHYLLVECGEFFWSLARESGLGEENMIRSSSMALRALRASETFCDSQSLPEGTSLPFSHPYFASVIEGVCEFARVKRMKLPPVPCTPEEMERAIEALCYALSCVTKHPCPISTYNGWTNALVKILKSWLSFCVGVFLLRCCRYPFEAGKYETTSVAATRLSNSAMCLKVSQHPDAGPYSTEAEEMLASGYRHDVKEGTQYYKDVVTPGFWTRHGERSLFKGLYSEEDSISRVFQLVGCEEPYTL